MIFGEEDDEFDEDMAELFQEFIEDGTQRFEALKAASFADDKDFIAKESHKLKGSASNFGFARVADFLAHIEDDIDTITASDFQATLSAAASSFDESMQKVTTRYPALATGCN